MSANVNSNRFQQCVRHCNHKDLNNGFDVPWLKQEVCECIEDESRISQETFKCIESEYKDNATD